MTAHAMDDGLGRGGTRVYAESLTAVTYRMIIGGYTVLQIAEESKIIVDLLPIVLTKLPKMKLRLLP